MCDIYPLLVNNRNNVNNLSFSWLRDFHEINSSISETSIDWAIMESYDQGGLL